MTRFLIALTSLLASCQHQVPDGYVEHSIDLKNNLGQLTIFLPENLDTFYTLTSSSDNSCGYYELFCFADQNYTIHQETGIFQLADSDSLYQMTISQLKYPACADKDLIIDTDYLKYTTQRALIDNHKIQFRINEIRAIHNQNYLIQAHSMNDSSKEFAKLRAETVIDGQPVSVNFTCLAKRCPGFINKMERSLESLRVKPPSR